MAAIPAETPVVIEEIEEEEVVGDTIEEEEKDLPQAPVRDLPLPSPSPALPANNSLAGNLARYLLNWQKITTNHFIFNIIQNGYKLQFFHSPLQSAPIITQPSKSKLSILISLIDDLLLSGAISQVEPNDKQHVYRIFSVNKRK